MKIVSLLLLLCISAFGGTPLKDAYLQSDLDARGKNINNAGNVSGTFIATGNVGFTNGSILMSSYVGGQAVALTLTSSGTLATFTSVYAEPYIVGDTVTISGANQANYNGTFTITARLANNVFQYVMTGTAVSPATGFILAQGVNLPTYRGGGNLTDHGISWTDPSDPFGSSQSAGIFNWWDHGGMAHNELIINSANSISFNIGLDGTGSGHVQLGTSNPTHDFWYFQYDIHPSGGAPFGYSKVLGFIVPWNGGQAAPNLQGVAYDTLGDYAIELSAGPTDGNNPFFSSGWQKGPLLHQFGSKRYNVLTPMNFANMTAESTNNAVVQLDFDLRQTVDMSVTISPITVKSINLRPGLTNYARRVFLLRSGAQTSIAINYPTIWNTNGLALPASMVQGNMLRLELEYIAGPNQATTVLGESNINVVSVQVLKDNTFSFDPDAQSFFTRASITDPTQQGAVNALAVAAKAHGWWNNCDAIYPMVGGNATAHSQNLKQNLYNIVWHGGVSHAGANGPTGDGVSGSYGDTLFNPSTATTPLFVRDSAHIFFYGGTTTPTDGGYFMGGQSGSFLMGIRRNASFLDSRGPNDGDFSGPLCVASTDFRGPLILQRAGPSGPNNTFARGNTSGNGSTASTGVPNIVFFILDYNTGAPGAMTTANCRGATIGSKIGDGSQTAIDTFRTDWDNYEQALSRKAPP